MKKTIGIVCFVLVSIVLLFTCTTALAWGMNSGEQYENAIGLLKENKYAEAAQEFIALKGYADAPRYAMYCNAVAAAEKGNLAVAVQNLGSLNGFLDSTLLVSYYSALGYESLEMYEQAEELLQAISLYKDGAERLNKFPDLIQQRDYRIADSNETSGKLDSALSGFIALGNYKDSVDRARVVKEKINERDYAAAVVLAEKKEFENAKSAFLLLGNFKDSAEQAQAMQVAMNERDYQNAVLYEGKGEYAAAYDAFVALGDYNDCAARAASVRQRAEYAKGLAAIRDEKYKAAFEIFTALGDFEDSKTKTYILGITGFASLETVQEGIATFSFHRKTGLVNLNENITVPPQWSSVGDFEDGVAWAQKDDLYGVIDVHGNVLSSYSWYNISRFKDGFCLVAAKNANWENYSDPLYLLVLMNNKGELVNNNGWFSFGSVSHEDILDYFNGLDSKPPVFSNGLISVSNENGFGFMNQAGEVVIDTKYEAAKEFSNGLAAVSLGKKWGFINTLGETVIPLKYSEVTPFTDSGLADVNLNGEWQIIDKEGELIYFK